MLWGRVVGKADLALLLAQPLCPLVLLRAEVAPADPPTAQCETACGNAMWERTMGTRHTRTPSGSDGLWEHPVGAPHQRRMEREPPVPPLTRLPSSARSP